MMYQENNHRKWQSPPSSNPPLDNLKTFLQKRIRAIMAKEWWDFIVNVNTLNSDHASLLYSLANLCPSFNYFLQSKDKELQLIVKKRPVVKPRIFSGSEKLDTTPEPIVPKQMPLITRRNSASELVKILNELYPNENIIKGKSSKTYGPASKQRKTLQGPNKKNSSVGDLIKKNNVPNGGCGHSPLLSRLLADESQKENAHTTNTKKVQLSLPSLLEDNNEYCKAVLSNTNYDLNQNRLNQSPRKIKKIIKVKKKRYVYSSGLTDPKNRLKFILEDETPSLSLKLIKKYRIKRCSVNLIRLKDSILKYYDELRYSSCVQIASEPEKTLSLLSNEESQLNAIAVQVTCQDSGLNTNSIAHPSFMPSLSESEAVQEKNVLPNVRKENGPLLEKFNPKELKNMYCHGGIVPLGKVLSSDKGINDLKNNKNFLSLKEKKLKDIIHDKGDTVIKPKEINLKLEGNGMIKPKEINLKFEENGMIKPKETNLKLEENGIIKPKEINLKLEENDMIKSKETNSKLEENDMIKSKETNSKLEESGMIKAIEFNSGSEENETVTPKTNSKLKDSEVLTTETIHNKSPVNTTMESNEQISCSDNGSEDKLENSESAMFIASYKESSSFQEQEVVTSEVASIAKNNASETNSTDINEIINDFVAESSCNDNISKTKVDIVVPEQARINCDSLKKLSEACINETLRINSEKPGEINETSVCKSEKSVNVNEKEVTEAPNKLEEVVKYKTASGVDELTDSNYEPEILNESSAEKSVESTSLDKTNNFVDTNESICKETEEIGPLAKRPRIEINLTEMKLEITKTIVESKSNDDHVCKMCKFSFDSSESWNNHFENNVPKCTPNLKVTWDNTELSVFTE